MHVASYPSESESSSPFEGSNEESESAIDLDDFVQSDMPLECKQSSASKFDLLRISRHVQVFVCWYGKFF